MNGSDKQQNWWQSSPMNRPVILVDLDNVVYDWAKSMAMWLDGNDALPFWSWNYPIIEEAMRKYKSWSVWEDWNIPKGEFIRWWRLGVEAEAIYASGPLISGAREALWKLSDAEWDIHIATSRLTKFGLHDKIVANTSIWLRDNNIPYRSIHFTDWKPGIAAEAIVDDRGDNMSEEAHMKTFLFPANHNKKTFVTAKEQREAWERIVAELT